MSDVLTVRRETLARVMEIVAAFGSGRSLDDILELIAQAVVDVIGFEAVAINVRRRDGDLEVRTVVGPAELEELRGGAMSHAKWLELLDTGVAWGRMRFLRHPNLDATVPHVDPRPERLVRADPAAADIGVEPWRPEFALLVPMWRSAAELVGVISVDLPRSGLTPDADQRSLLELFGSQAGAAIERVEAMDSATDNASIYRTAFAASPAATMILDHTFRVSEANISVEGLVGAAPGLLVGVALSDIVDVDETAAAGLATLAPGDSVVLAEQSRVLRWGGSTSDRWVHVAVSHVDVLTTGGRYVCTLTDQTAARASLAEVRRRAEHDELTGLKMRAVGLGELERRMAAASAPAIALLLCDLDNFKPINDELGHLTGDTILEAVAASLESAVEPGDVVFRWGGDEFGVVVERGDFDEVLDLAHRLVMNVGAVAAAAPSNSPVARLQLSVGIAKIRARVDVLAAVAGADAALYRSKSHLDVRVHVQPV